MKTHRPGPPEVLTDKQRDWAYEKWRSGYTQVEIAAALFVAEATIRRTFDRHGLTKHKPALKYQEDPNE